MRSPVPWRTARHRERAASHPAPRFTVGGMRFDRTPIFVWKDGRPWLGLYATDMAEGVLAKADQPNERWITLHPHGEKGEGKGVPVKIRVGADGAGHIVSGPGELRGLRLTRLASPEELAKRKAERDARKREQAKSEKEAQARQEQEDLERSAQDPEHAQRVAQEKIAKQKEAEERSARLSSLEERMAKLHGELLDHAATITGDHAYQGERARAAFDPKEYKDYKEGLRARAQAAAVATRAGVDEGAAGGAGAVIASRNVRQISGGLKALRRHLVSTLVKDSDLRGAVLGEEGELDPEAGQAKRASGSPGYKRDVKGQAARQDFTPEDARAESSQVFRDRMARLRQEGEHERAGAIEEMRERTLDRAQAERALKGALGPDGETLNTAAPVRTATPEQVAQHAEHVRRFLELHSQLEALEKEKRALELGCDPAASASEKTALDGFDKPLPPGAETGTGISDVDPQFAARLDAEIKDAAKADVTRAFLDMLEEGEGGRADNLIRQQMQAHLGAGAHAHLANAALSVLGHEGVDRQVVDALGIDAAAQLVAHAIHRDAADVRSVRDGLARHHDETSLPRMQEAMDLARAARADVAELELPPVTSSTDAAVVRDLQKRRKEAIGAAHEALGSALGAVEAGAALNLALKGQRNSLTVRFGQAPTAPVAMQLRALGLQDGEYELSRDTETNALTARITREGMDRLTPKLDPQREQIAREVREIKSGEQDEADYLPAGFMRRADTDLDPNPGIPAAFQQQADWTKGAGQAAQDVAASMYADGFKPSEIMRHLLDTVAQECPEGQHGAFAQAVTDLIPFATTEQRVAQDGTTYTAHVARDVDRDPEIAARLSHLSQAWLAQHHPGEADFHSQRVEDDERTREALFRAVAERPALQAAFAPPADLGGSPEGREKAQAIKTYFFQHVIGQRLGGKSPREYDEAAKAAQEAALAKLGPAPEKWGGGGGGMFDMFGGGPDPDAPTILTLSPHATPEQHVQALQAFGLRPEHYELGGNAATLNEVGKAALRIPPTRPTVDGTPNSPEIVQGGLDALNPAWVDHQSRVNRARTQHPTLSDLWGNFKETMRGTRNAYAAVQEVMQHDLLTRFTHHHAALTGRQLRVSKATTRHWERRLAATDPDEAERIRARDRKIMDEVRGRDSSGRYLNMGEGGLVGAVQEHLEQQARQANLMGSLFGLGTGKVGGEVTGKRPQDLDVGAHERLSLGEAAEGQLSRMLNGTRWGIKATDGPNKLLRNLTWGAGTAHVTKQRAVKLLLASGRMAGWLGAGCVHRDTLLTDAETGETRTFHEWMEAGLAPKVHALTPDRRVVVAQATRPFIKDYAMMYRVTTASGQTVTVSGGHQFLTAHGWARLDTLTVGHEIAAPASPLLPASAQALPGSSSEPGLATSPRDALHSTGTPQDSQAHCSDDSRPYGEPLQLEAGAVQAPAPLQGDVPGRTRSSSHGDGQPLATEHSPAYQCGDLPASLDCLPQVETPVGGVAVPAPSIPSALSRPTCSGPERSGDTTSPARAAHEAPRHVLQAPAPASSCSPIPAPVPERAVTPTSHSPQASLPQPHTDHAPQTGQGLAGESPLNMRLARCQDSLAWDVVVEITPVGKDFVYDITVPGPATYYAHGLWHHNSGKTGTMLGAFTQAHSEGKARKALYVVPSIVRNQFGEAAAKFTQPGKYRWHAEDATFDERKAHYSGDTHMIVVTHQTFRDDMLKLLAEHQGVPVGQVGDWFGQLPREDRARVFRAALDHHGIPLDMLHVDEAHDFLNRAGKQDSTMSKVLEAALDNARYKALWTGSPVKNDPSEVHDWLSKLDPERFADREEFLRRYGVNTKASAEALQRLVDSYSVIDSVRPDVDREVVWGQHGAQPAQPIPLTQEQQQALQGVHEAFERASAAQRRGQVDVEAAKLLSPRSFEGQPEDQHRVIAARLQSALGTLKHAAIGRVVNEHDPATNAKVQHVLNLAHARRGRGGVIFARNRRSIAMLKEQLEAQGHRVGVIDGSTTTDGKGKVRKAFDAGHVDIVLCSDAGATGANLQHRGEWLVNYDLPLTQKTLEQRNARIDRLGQTKKVELHHLVTDTAYDRDNVQRLTRKRELGSILQGEYRDMDDTGLAAYIRRARAEREGDVPEAWEEPLGPGLDENARPERPVTPSDLNAQAGTPMPGAEHSLSA